MGLQNLVLQFINEMIGGEFQKVAISRALVQEPRVMLLDEPTSNLDLHNQVKILQVMKQITKEHKMAVEMTLHDLNMAVRFIDRFLFVKDVEIFACGNKEEITSEMIKKVYDLPVRVIDNDGYPTVITDIGAAKPA